MEFQQIQYFLKAAEEENFTKAAQAFYVSPQSVAKQVSLLEKELGCSLFDREGKRVVLNSNGEFAYQRLKEADNVFKNAIDEIRRQIKGFNTCVSISFFSALPQKELISPLLTALFSHFPDYQFEIRMLQMHEAIQDLIKNKSDIVVTNVEEKDEFENIERIVFRKSPAEIIVAPGHPWWSRDSVTIEDMKQMEMLKIQENLRVEQGSRFYLQIPCSEIIPVPNFATMYTMLEHGKAFAVVPNAFLNANQTDFHFLPLPIETEFFETAALYRKDISHPAACRVIDFLQNEWNND